MIDLVSSAAISVLLSAHAPDRLTPAQRIELLTALERQRAWIDAEQQRLLAAMARDPQPADANGALDKQWVREDVACALRIPAATAAERLSLAGDLVDRLPTTLKALSNGDISLNHARTLADAVRSLPDSDATKVETRVLGGAVRQTVANFRRCVHRAVLAVDERRAEQRHRDAAADRRVTRRPDVDGMGELWALLPADRLTALWNAVDTRAARSAADDDRTADQRRADALVELVLRPDADCAPPSGPQVQVTVALSTLLDLDDQSADLDGYGPIPAALARRLAFDPTGTWRRLVVDPLGRLVDYGRRRYRPGIALAEHVTARDLTCRFPGCSRRATRCELDHVQDWQLGGTTCAANLHPLCRRHHHAKHDAGWTVTRDDHGTTRWTSPTGHCYDADPPPPLPVDRTSEAPASRSGPDARSALRSDPQPASDPRSDRRPTACAEPDTMHTPEPDTRHRAEPHTRHGAKPGGRPGAKPDTRHGTKPGGGHGAKPDTRHASESEASTIRDDPPF